MHWRGARSVTCEINLLRRCRPQVAGVIASDDAVRSWSSIPAHRRPASGPAQGGLPYLPVRWRVESARLARRQGRDRSTGHRFASVWRFARLLGRFVRSVRSWGRRDPWRLGPTVRPVGNDGSGAGRLRPPARRRRLARGTGRAGCSGGAADLFTLRASCRARCSPWWRTGG